jgi:hypothetical protein
MKRTRSKKSCDTVPLRSSVSWLDVKVMVTAIPRYSILVLCVESRVRVAARSRSSISRLEVTISITTISWSRVSCFFLNNSGLASNVKIGSPLVKGYHAIPRSSVSWSEVKLTKTAKPVQ